MKKVLVTCPPMLRQIEKFQTLFDERGFDVTAPSVVQTLSIESLVRIVPEHDGWIIGDDPATLAVFEAGKAGRLRAAVKWGVGTDNVDFQACENLNIPIANTPNMFGNEVADLAIGYVIALARETFSIDRGVRAGGWPKPSGISLSEKRIGVIGLGDIGSTIARRAQAFGMSVTGWDPYPSHMTESVDLKKWPEGVEDCDFLVFACSLTEKTKHMFNHSLLPALKPQVRLVNVSRGGLIDETALVAGIGSGIISGAALDVFEVEPLALDSALRSYEQVIFGSHNGSNTIDAVLRTSFRAIDLLTELMNGH